MDRGGDENEWHGGGGDLRGQKRASYGDSLDGEKRFRRGYERRDDREWERGGMDGARRAPRDLYDRAPRRGARRERGSPPPQGTHRLSERKRRVSLWDIWASGFEKTDALGAKASGYFGAPVNAREMAMMPPGFQGSVPLGAPASIGVPKSVDPDTAAAIYQATIHKQLRRLQVGNVSPDMTNTNLREFINAKMNEKRFSTSGSMEPCASADVQLDRGTAYLEFREPSEATHALSLDGVRFQAHVLSIRRTDEYVGPVIDDVMEGLTETTVPEGPNRLYVANIPTFLEEDQVMELLRAFGELRQFDLLRNSTTGGSRGVAYCEYEDEAVTPLACEGLSGLEVGDRRLIVKRADAALAEDAQRGVPMQETSDEPTRAFTLLNMVAPDELMDDQEYGEIVDDVREECNKYGAVEDIRIPRPVRRTQARTWKEQASLAETQVEHHGVGRVYVKFGAVEPCSKALHAIAGRQFGGRTVICAYLREDVWPSDQDGWPPREPEPEPEGLSEEIPA
ncbi:hypothetical protein MSPP1_001534 [Malassezia sp. CBS 17886]|nr:hypothetical protein MSPP1_001534 [Malassezia sp. CBS 17886]